MPHLSIEERLGLSLSVICRRGCYLDYPIASLKLWLLPPAQLSQLHVFVGLDRRLLGYMTWAWFSEETESRWMTGNVEMLHISEWNEGAHLWIIDFVPLAGYTHLCTRLAADLFPPGTVAHSLGRRQVGGQLPVVRWERLDLGRRKIRRTVSGGCALYDHFSDL